MANTYSQIYIHVIFSVKDREPLLRDYFRSEVFGYIGDILKGRGNSLIAVNGLADHVHLFIGMKPKYTLSEIIRDVKSNSSRYINRRGWLKKKFEWQSGFGAFSYSHSQKEIVSAYIINQECHHRNRGFEHEFNLFLKKFNILPGGHSITSRKS